jgi:hypothetical protein
MDNLYNPDWILKLNDIYAALIQLEGKEAATKKYNEAIHNRVVEIMGLYASHVVPLSSCMEAIQNIKDNTWAEGTNDLSSNSIHKGEDEAIETALGGTAQYKTGDLIIPRDIDELPILSVNMQTFKAPNTIDLRDYCIKTDDQKSNPWCAAYAAAGFASNINWRKHDTITEYNKESIYKTAKQIDGTDPTTEGTTLTAVLEVLLMKGIFDSGKCQTKVIRNINQIKYAIHKFGCCLLGVMVTKEWYKCNKNKSTISGKYDKEKMGGHAVLCCGYNQDGIIIQNSWGGNWGSYGFALITWDEVERSFCYGAVLNNCLYDTKMN